MLIFKTDHVADVAPRVRVVVDVAVNINTAGTKLLEKTNHGRASGTCMGIVNFLLFPSLMLVNSIPPLIHTVKGAVVGSWLRASKNHLQRQKFSH